MKSFIRNLLPQDTRPLEILSGVSLLLLSIAFGLFPGVPMELIYEHPIEFWQILTFILSLIQLGAILFHPRHFHTRIAGLWGTGCFWVFFAFNNGFNPLNSIVNSIVVAVLGVSCMIAFVINSIILSENHKNKGNKWKQ